MPGPDESTIGGLDGDPNALPRAHDGRRIRLGSGTAWVVAVQLIAAASTILISAIVARWLGPDGKGVLSLLQQSVTLLAVLGELGLGIAAIYYVSKGDVHPGTVLGNALVLLGVVSVVAFGGLVVLLRTPLAVVEVTWAHVFVGLALFAATLLLSWSGSIVTSVEGTRGAARASVAASLVTLGVVYWLWVSLRLTPLGVLVASTIGAVLGIAVGLVPARRALAPIRARMTVFRSMFHYSLRLHAASAADLVHFRQDLLLLGWLAGTSAVGVYSVALSLAEIASRLPSAIGTAIQAQASRVSEESALDFSARALRLTAVVSVATTGALSLVAAFAVPLIFGPSFVPAVGVVYLMVPRMLANALVWPVTSYQSARGVVYWKIGVLTALANAALNVVLIPALDYHGAAIAASASNLLLVAMLMSRLCRDTRRRPAFFLVPTRDDFRIAREALRSYTRRDT
jgi:O-antigen/teichoic acid export membrane protein